MTQSDPLNEIDISKDKVEEWAGVCSDIGQNRSTQLFRALSSRVERLESAYEETTNKLHNLRRLHRAEKVRAALDEQRLAAAVEALKPFAKAASYVSPGHKTAFVFVDDLRRAAAALQLQESNYGAE